jgi:HAD superfamily hydrolase (TIGR01458 family)
VNNRIRAALIDLDGTLYFKGAAIPGAPEAIDQLRRMGVKMRFLTNTDSISAAEIHARVSSFGLRVQPEEIYCPSVAALSFFGAHPDKTCYCLVSKSLLPVFADLNWNESRPDYVVVGDCRDRVSYEEFNRVFRFLHEGAELLALSKGRFFYNADGIHLDTGAFVSLFEFASGKKAEVLGKPAASYFNQALADLGVSAGEAVVVGDDMTTDVQGALNVGAHGVLVQTGKYTDDTLAKNEVKPEMVLSSVAGLPEALRRVNNSR